MSVADPELQLIQSYFSAVVPLDLLRLVACGRMAAADASIRLAVSADLSC